MDVREKLVDDVHGKLMGLLQRAPYIRCEDVYRQYAVNWLMNNGVTVQEWISVKDRLPTEEDANERGWVLAYSNDNRHIIADYESVILFSHLISHWKVLTSPQLPKGE